MGFQEGAHANACIYLTKHLYLEIYLWVTLVWHNYSLSVRCLTAYRGDLVLWETLPSIPKDRSGSPGSTWRHLKEQRKRQQGVGKMHKLRPWLVWFSWLKFVL